jgi:DNA ligase-1
MPKSVKAPPPQQASLKEMWGKRTTKTEEEDEKLDLGGAMNIEPENNNKGMEVKFQNQFISTRFSREL